MEFVLVSDWKRWPCEEPQLAEIFAREFASRGHRVHWIALVSGQKEASREETWHGHPVHLLRRGLPGLAALSSLLRRLLAERPVDFVQVRNDPLFALLAARLARRSGVPFVYHLSILNGPVLADEAVWEPWPRSWWLRLKGAVGGALVERAALSCSLLLAISDAMAEHFVGKGRTGPTAALPMGFRALPAPPRPAPRPESGTVELLYIGALDAVRGLEFLLRSLAQAMKAEPRLRLTFLGSARREGDVARLKRSAQALGLERAVRFLPAVPRSEVPAFIAAADIGLSPVPPTPYYLLSSPTKLVEFMGLGKLVVANDIPDQRALLEASGGGICAPYQEEAFAAAILRLAADEGFRLEAGRRAAEYALKHREYAVLADRAEQAYRDLLGKA